MRIVFSYRHVVIKYPNFFINIFFVLDSYGSFLNLRDNRINLDFEKINNIAVNIEESSVTFDYESEEKLNEVKEKLKSLGYPEDGEANSLMEKAKSYVSCAIGKMS